VALPALWPDPPCVCNYLLSRGMASLGLILREAIACAVCVRTRHPTTNRRKNKSHSMMTCASEETISTATRQSFHRHLHFVMHQFNNQGLLDLDNLFHLNGCDRYRVTNVTQLMHIGPRCSPTKTFVECLVQFQHCSHDESGFGSSDMDVSDNTRLHWVMQLKLTGPLDVPVQ